MADMHISFQHRTWWTSGKALVRLVLLGDGQFYGSSLFHCLRGQLFKARQLFRAHKTKSQTGSVFLSMLTTWTLVQGPITKVTFRLGVKESNHQQSWQAVLREIITLYVTSHLGLLLLTELVLVLAAFFQKLASKFSCFSCLSQIWTCIVLDLWDIMRKNTRNVREKTNKDGSQLGSFCFQN